MAILMFVIGLLIGSFFGVMLTCLLQINRLNKKENER